MQPFNNDNFDIIVPESQSHCYQTEFGVFQVITQANTIIRAEFIDENNDHVHAPFSEIVVQFAQYDLKPMGTEFQQRVWQEVQKIPMGNTTSYLDIAMRMGSPKAVRAVGMAISHNPIAYFIPCHRVIHSNGALGNYRWGEGLKPRLIDWERTS
jgi:O-6-methylguanine DNA methyltransferase